MAAFGDVPARLAELERLLGPLPDAGLPIALLPVHLETRFVQDELLVRIRPDTLSVDAHEPGLTAGEIECGRTYWEEVWRSGDDRDRRSSAWSQLAGQYGAQRAGWIVRALAPMNPRDRPATRVIDPPVAPRFPEPDRQERAWTVPAVVRGEPDRWVVLGYRSRKRVFVAWGEPVAEGLAVTPAPGLDVDEALRWLADFAAAERAGMGVRAKLPAGEAAKGFDALLAFGIRTRDGAALLESLLEAQAFTEGVAFMAPGTATNNTEAGGARAERDLEPALAAGRRLPTGSNGALTAAALGIAASVFLDADRADSRDDRDAEAMNVALWPATGGYFLEQFLDGAAAGAGARRHVVRHVRPGGPLPVVRIGRQPYGLLPVTALDRLRAGGPGEQRLIRGLLALRAAWRALPVAGGADAEQALLDVLRLDFASAGYRARLVFDRAFFGAPEVPVSGTGPPAAALEHRKLLAAALAAAGIDGQPRLLDVFPSTPPFSLDSALVQSGPGERLEPNYLDWLRRATFDDILRESHRPGLDIDDRSLDSLLYLVARHSVLLAYAMAGHRVLVADPYREPALIDIEGAERARRTPTLLRRLIDGAAAVSDRPLHEIVHTLGAAQHPEAAELDDLRDALAHLASRPVATLERLLRESLDLYAHRLDAWLTSLATKRLAELREKRPRGLLLGGYGWVENLRPAARTLVAQPPPGEADGPLYVDPASGGALHAPSLAQATAGAILRSGFLSDRGDGGERPLAVDLSSARVRLATDLLDGMRQGQPLAALLGYRFERGLHDRLLDQFIAAFRGIAPFGELAEAREARDAARAALDAALRLPHPNLVKARDDVAKFTRLLTNLKSEQAGLPGRLRAAEDEIKRLGTVIDQRQKVLGNLLAHLGDKPPSATIERLSDEIVRLGEQRRKKQQERDRIRARQGTIRADIVTADENLRAALNDEKEFRGREHPSVADARKALAEAQTRFEALLRAYRERYLFPPTKTLEALESLAEVTVVDGWELLKLWRDGRIPWERVAARSRIERGGLEAELTALDDAVDALGDALTAEGVFQLARGNPQRAGAAVDAVVNGEVPPPELEAMRTPRSGAGLTHRLVLLFAGPPAAPPPGWVADERHARAAAEPHLNAWAGHVLGRPARVRCRAEYLDPASGRSLQRRELRLSELQLSPLDVVYASPTGDRGTLAALERLLVFHAVSTPPPGVPADAVVRLDVARGANWTSDLLGLEEAAELAGAIRRLIDGARPLAGDDLSHPSRPGPPAEVVRDLERRADAAVRGLRAVRDRLEAAAANPADLHAALAAGFHFGLHGSILEAAGATPTGGAVGSSAAALADAAGAAAREAGQRLAAVAELERAAGSEAERDHELRRLELVFGRGFRALPRLEPANVADLTAGFGAAAELLGDDPHAAVTWFQRAARVRPGAGRLHDVLLYAAAVGAPGVERFRVCQLPRRPGERWVGLDGPVAPGGRLSVVAHLPFPGELRANQPLAGLLVDDWAEVVPDPMQVTGVALQFDAPAARAPQAVLLAVAPGDRPQWDLGAVESALLDTLDLAKLRATNPEALAKAGGLARALPALYLGLNLSGDTVSTDFRRAAG